MSFDFSGLGLLESDNVFAFSSGYQSLGSLGSEPLALSLRIFSDEIMSGLLNIRVQTSGLLFESIRLDGVNLHVETTPTNRVPEPATLMLTGVGMAAGAVFQRRRRRTAGQRPA